MKYEITDIQHPDNPNLRRIRALKSFGNVNVGDVGGYVQSEDNLSRAGNCWVYPNAKVYDNSEVFGFVKVSGIASVFGNAKVYDNSEVFGFAKVSGNAEISGKSEVYGESKVSGDVHVIGKSKMMRFSAMIKCIIIRLSDNFEFLKSHPMRKLVEIQ